MRVLHIISGLKDGGAEASLYRLVLNNSENKHGIISLTDGGKYGPLLSNLNCPLYLIGIDGHFLRLRNFLEIYRSIKAFRPDAIQTWMYHADLIGAIFSIFFSIPLFWGIHNTVLVSGVSKARTILVARLCAAFSYFRGNKIICCALSAKLAHISIGYNEKKMVVIPNGYDLQEFNRDTGKRTQMRQELGIDINAVVVGMVGRYDPYKDHANFLDALQINKEKNCEYISLLVGAGMDSSNIPLVEAIKSRNLGDSVLLLGRRSDIPAIMNAVDLHVLSSSAEAFPNVLAEAMACGTPCVTTDVGDAKLIIGDTGWVVPRCSPELLAHSIRVALEEKQKSKDWRTRQESARKRIVDNYSIQAMVVAYNNLWKSAN